MTSPEGENITNRMGKEEQNWENHEKGDDDDDEDDDEKGLNFNLLLQYSITV